ncbi:MAG: NEW3 domain-containing protein [Acidimicrobiia bacterium]
MKRTRTLIGSLAALLLVVALPASAQVDTTLTTLPTTLTVTTPYPGVVVEPGDQVTFDLTIASPQRDDVKLSVDGVPDGWTSSFRGGGFDIDRVMAGPGVEPSVNFGVTVPVDASEGSYDMTVIAASSTKTVRLPLSISVSKQAGGEVTLTPDFPGLRAPAGEQATFNVTLRNGTPADLQFQLEATGPAGWDVTAEPASKAQASTVSVKAGSQETINVNATSPANIDAGQYSISVKATSGDTEAQADMVVDIVGSYSVTLSTADQRLNADVSAGSASDLQLVVSNTGTAPLQGATISATPPSNWDVTFDTPTLPDIAPGDTSVVTATITPSTDAVAGDYIVSFRVSQDQANDSIDVRTTVNPSPVWGFVGVAVIALTLAGLAWVFRRFGRR